MRTIIIGKKSNLSKQLSCSIDNVILISSMSVIDSINELNLSTDESVNIIFNNFQTASKLNSLENPIEYIERSIMVTAKVLDFIQSNNLSINKIIYTSSSSVYGNNIFCKESDTLTPLSLHSSLKITNEKLIENFSQKNSINFTIARIFNMYGGDDNFSIISKIEKAYRGDTSIVLVNSGNAIRDFIHIDDVVSVYQRLLTTENTPIINIGTGVGISIKNIIDFLSNHNISIKTQTINSKEIKISTADIGLLESKYSINFRKVEDFLLEKLSGSNNE